MFKGKGIESILSEKLSEIKDNFKIKLKIKNVSNNTLPKYESDNASGFDLKAFLSEPIYLEPGQTAVVPTGLFFEIPDGFEIQVRPRSGLAAKNSVTVLNSPGTIDADYTGECKVILINHSRTETFKIENGNRIAQGVFAPVLNNRLVSILEVENIEKETERSDKGFGSTGV